MRQELAQNKWATWLLLLLALWVGSSSCAVGHRSPTFTSPSQPYYVLKPGTYQVVGRVTGQASCPFLFWIDVRQAWESRPSVTIPLLSIGLGDTDLRTQAMADLHTKVEIQGKRRVLHNIMEEAIIANYLGLFAILRYTISAEVIEFTRSPS